MTSINAQNLIMFHLHVEGFKTSAEQTASTMRAVGGDATPSRVENSIKSQREAAQHIYNTYLSEQVGVPRRRFLESMKLLLTVFAGYRISTLRL